MGLPVTRLIDDGLIESYREDLYQFQGLAETVPNLAGVGPKELEFFASHGYLAVEEVFSTSEVKAALDGLMSLLAGDNPEFKGVLYEKASAHTNVESLSVEERQDYVRKFMYFVEYQQNLKEMSLHSELLRVVSEIIGGRPVLFQDMALLKPPHIGREKPWHQDHAYFNYELQTRVVGVWIALDEATTENGCMVVMPGSHLEGPLIHFRRRDWQICDSEANQGSAIAVPLRPGGVLFFSSLMHHGTPTNQSNERRRAIQFHYCPQGTEKVSQADRMEIFGEEGKNVTC